MPTLNRYSPDSDKEGYYIRANVGGNAPITLQVSYIAERIFEAVGYDDGDSLPSKLVWAMYDLDMTFTLTSLDIDESPDDLDPASVLEDLGLDSKLSEEERQELIGYLARYSGPSEGRVKQLREMLLDSVSADSLEELDLDQRGEWFPERKQLPETTDEVREVLRAWTEGKTQERAEKALVVSEEFVKWSVRTFAAHPRLTERPLIAIRSREMVYELEPEGTVREVRIADARGKRRQIESGRTRHSYDYRVFRELNDGTKEEAYVSGETILKYESWNGSGGSRALMGFALEGILPPERSYFGGSDDQDASAAFLTRQYLRRPRDELAELSAELEEADLDDNDDPDDEDSPAIPAAVKEAVREMGNYTIATVTRKSNAGNPVCGDIRPSIVITDGPRVGVGDSVIVPAPSSQGENEAVDGAARISQVPPDRPKEWVRNNL